MIDNCTLANSIGLYLSLNLREQLHTEMKLFHSYKIVIAVGCGRTVIYCGGTDVYCGGTVIYCGGTDDLMSDKYITSLLLIRMLKAFLRVTLNHNSLIHTVTNTIALKFCMFEAVPSIQNSHCSRMWLDSYILQWDSYILWWDSYILQWDSYILWWDS